jgi:hypothetical protein
VFTDTENKDIDTINSNNRIAATMYSLGTIFCFRNIRKNTLHKGDNDDDNNNTNNNKNDKAGYFFSEYFDEDVGCYWMNLRKEEDTLI